MGLEDAIEFAANPEPRCPCVLLLDTSGSMEGAKIEQVNAGLAAFHQALQTDPLGRKRVEVCVIAFDTSVVVVQNFVTIDNFEPPVLAGSGQTRLVAGLQEALDTLDARKATYKSNGIAYYRPWLFLMTDGEPTDLENIEPVRARLVKDVTNKRVAFFPVGVEGANMTTLRDICPVGNAPARLNGLDFVPMFQWLSASLQQVSNSQVGEQVALAPVNWAY